MRENRLSGSEGGAGHIPVPTPIMWSRAFGKGGSESGDRSVGSHLVCDRRGVATVRRGAEGG